MNNARLLAPVFTIAALACSPAFNAPPTLSQITLSATPSVITPGGTAQLALANGSTTSIGANLCPITVERRDGSAWVRVASGQGVFCQLPEHILAPGARDTGMTSLDPAAVAGTYRVRTSVEILSDHAWVTVLSNSFTVQP